MFIDNKLTFDPLEMIGPVLLPTKRVMQKT